MATTYGLTLAGLVIKAFAAIRAEVDASVRSNLGSEVPLGDRTLVGQYNAIWAEREASIWQLIEVIYSASDPDKATGAALDALCLLTGTLRPAATHSAVTLTLCGIPTTLIAAGSRVRTASTGIVFETLADATLVIKNPWVSLTSYVAGDVVYRNLSGTNTMFQCYLAVSGSTAPESDPTHWIQVGLGTASVTADAISSDTGAIEASSGTLTQIVTGVGGWQTAYNVTDATIGRSQATDEELRLLREAELAAPGTAPIDAIRADILAISGVETCTVFDNPTDVTNVDGMPPHSVEALVQGGDDQVICDRLLTSVAAGIATTGTVSGVSTDTQGIDHVMKFSRPQEIPIYVIANIVKDPKTYPIDGDAQVVAAIVARGNLGGAGKDAVSTMIVAACFSVPGVLDVTNAFLGVAPAPASTTTIPVSTRQIAVWDSGPTRTVVNSINGTP